MKHFELLEVTFELQINKMRRKRFETVYSTQFRKISFINYYFIEHFKCNKYYVNKNLFRSVATEKMYSFYATQLNYHPSAGRKKDETV